jgi:hypothetical protein
MVTDLMPGESKNLKLIFYKFEFHFQEYCSILMDSMLKYEKLRKNFYVMEKA